LHQGFSTPIALFLALRNVLGIVNQPTFFRHTVDRAQQVFDNVFQLALAFDSPRSCSEFVGFNRALDQSDGVALGNAVKLQSLRSFRFELTWSLRGQAGRRTRARISPETERILGAARISVVSMFTMR